MSLLRPAEQPAVPSAPIAPANTPCLTELDCEAQTQEIRLVLPPPLSLGKFQVVPPFVLTNPLEPQANGPNGMPWAYERSLCPHRNGWIERRVNMTMATTICLSCGSRWERIQLPSHISQTRQRSAEPTGRCPRLPGLAETSFVRGPHGTHSWQDTLADPIFVQETLRMVDQHDSTDPNFVIAYVMIHFYEVLHRKPHRPLPAVPPASTPAPTSATMEVSSAAASSTTRPETTPDTENWRTGLGKNELSTESLQFYKTRVAEAACGFSSAMPQELRTGVPDRFAGAAETCTVGCRRGKAALPDRASHS